MTIGYGLLIDLRRDSNWAKIIIFQALGGLGVGPNFQGPLIALQSGIDPRDIATATAAFGFVRNIGTAVSVVIGGVIFQNEMTKHRATLAASLPASAVNTLTGGGAAAAIGLVNSLPPTARRVAQNVYGESLAPMWIFYVCLSALALVVALFIKRQNLSREHKETETGLEAEKARRAAFAAEKEERAALKHHRHQPSTATERTGWTTEEEGNMSEMENMGHDVHERV